MRTLRPWLAPLALLLATGCSPDNDESAYVVESTWHTASLLYEPFVQDGFLVYWIDEAAMGVSGIDYNGNGLTDDNATFLLNVQDGFGWYPGLAALEVQVVGDDVFLVADEEIELEDLNDDGDEDDLVLMQFQFPTGVVSYVETLDPDTGTPYLLNANGNVWFTAEATTLSGDETALRYVDGFDPLTPVVVMNVPGGGPLRPRVMSIYNGLPLCVLDETVELQNLNGGGGLGTDTDMLDRFVLAIVDLNDIANDVVTIHNTELALASKTAPTWTVPIGGVPQDYLVTFLVSEVDQGGEDLNDPALFEMEWVLPQCSATADGDATDDVQFFLEYQSWLAGDTGPVNTGQAGVDRALAVPGYVGTLSDELDANCDLNQDGDTDDTVFRWVSIEQPIVPPAMLPLHAVALLPDESSGASPVLGAFVIAVDELADGEDHNGDGFEDDILLADNDPAGSLVWNFMPSDPKTGPRTLGVQWMAPFADASTTGLLPTTMLESEQGKTLNTTCLADWNDGDDTDVLPVWVRWDTAATAMFVAGYAFAAQSGNEGIAMFNGILYFRLSEAEQGQDWNGDGDMTDPILFRGPTSTCAPVAMTVANHLQGPIVFARDGALGACLYGDETINQEDYNRDGDTDDIVVRWFRY